MEVITQPVCECHAPSSFSPHTLLNEELDISRCVGTASHRSFTFHPSPTSPLPPPPLPHPSSPCPDHPEGKVEVGGECWRQEFPSAQAETLYCGATLSALTLINNYLVRFGILV